MNNNLLQRMFSGFFYVVIIFLFTTSFGSDFINSKFNTSITPRHLYFGLISFFLIICTYECFEILKFGNDYQKWLVLPIVLLVFYLFAKRYFNNDFYFNFKLNEYLSILLILIGCFTLFYNTTELYFDNGKLIFIVVYIAIPFGLALGLPKYNFAENTISLEVFLLFVLIV